MRFLPLVAVALVAGCDDPKPPVVPPPHVSTTNTSPPKPAGDPVTLSRGALDDFRSEWAGFREGSWAETRITIQSPKGKETINTKVTIQKVEEAKLSLVRQIQGRPARDESVKLSDDLRRLGTETIDVDGKAFACTIYETTETAGGETSRIKLWICKDAPGRKVKLEQISVVRGVEVKGVGVLKRLGQRVTIGKQQVSYAIFELKGKSPMDTDVSITRWVSEQVPGFLVREEKRITDGKDEVLKVEELVDFENK
jgi:hypothetical protein